MGWRHSCGRRHQCPTADTIDPTLYTQTRAHVVITDTPPRSTGTATRNTGTASTEDRNDDAADARRRAQPGRATVIGGHDEFTACRRRWSKAFRIALGNAPAEGFAQQISGEQTRCRMFFFQCRLSGVVVWKHWRCFPFSGRHTQFDRQKQLSRQVTQSWNDT